MKRLHRMILGMLPGPFFGWLVTLMFLLLMQFLIKYLPDIAGRGLPFSVIAELISYNLAYMLVLAVPMSILISSILVFGKLTETQAYLVIKSSGISPMQLIWPTLLVGLALTGAMTYFNNEVLPEANFRARNLWQDIRQKRPGFELKPGVFYDGLSRYSILVRDIPPESNDLIDVLIYDYTEGAGRQTTIKAARGTLMTEANGAQVVLTLHDGEVHRVRLNRRQGGGERYERISFDRYRLVLDLSDFVFERSDPRQGYRSDRTMRTFDMVSMVDSLEQGVDRRRQDLEAYLRRLGREDAFTAPESNALPSPRSPVRPIVYHAADSVSRDDVYDRAILDARNVRARVDEAKRTIQIEAQRAAQYEVEIHKKFSIAVACLIFTLIGAPLGLIVRRGGLGLRAGLAMGIFLFYWTTLVQGEKLADRGHLDPWVGMWGANLVMLVMGVYLMIHITMDLHGTPTLRQRLRERFSRSPRSAEV